MKKIYTVVAGLFVACGVASAAVPGLISYQGTLRKDGRLFSGTVPMEFSLTDVSGASKYWDSGSTNVVVSTGLFRYQLGASNAAQFAAIDWKDIAPYVVMTVDGVLLPPDPLYASAYALHSLTAESSTGTFTVNGGDLRLSGVGQLVFPDGTAQRSAAGWSVSANGYYVSFSGRAGVGVPVPSVALDIKPDTSSSAGYSQFWRDTSGTVVVASMSASGELFADASGLRNLPSGNIVDTLSATLGAGNDAGGQNIVNAGVVGASSLAFAPGVLLSSASQAEYGGILVSTNIYLPPGAKYYGDGSGLTGIGAGSGNIVDTLDATLNAGSNAGGYGMVNLGSVAIGAGSVAGRLDVQASSPGTYVQVWRDSSGVTVASMTDSGAFYADASKMRGLPSADNLGDHTATQALNMSGFDVRNAGAVTASGPVTVYSSVTVAGTSAFASTAAFTAQALSAPGVYISSGLVVASGSVGIGTSSPQETLDVNGGVRIGNSNRTAAGTIRYTGAAFQGYSGGGWVTLNGTFNLESSDSLWGVTSNTVYTVGASSMVAIGTMDAGVSKLRVTGTDNTSGSNALLAENQAFFPLLVVRDDGNIGMGVAAPAARLDVQSAGGYAQIWRASDGTVVSSMSDTGLLYADASALRGLPSGDNLGDHTLTRNLDTNGYWISGDGSSGGLSVNSGNVGIGINPPTVRLEISGGTGSGVKFDTFHCTGTDKLTLDLSGNLVCSSDQTGGNVVDTLSATLAAGHDAGGFGIVNVGSVTASGGIFTSSGVTVTGGSGVASPRLVLAAGVAISSSQYYGGLYISSNVYLPAGAKYYGDGSALSGVSGSDNFGDHIATKDINMAGFSILNVSALSAAPGAQGVQISTSLVVSGALGVMGPAGGASLDVMPSAAGYAQFWRNASGVVVATMTSSGVLYADGSQLRNLPSGGGGTLSSVLTAGSDAGGQNMVNIGDITEAGHLTAYSSMTVYGGLGVAGAIGASGPVSAVGGVSAGGLLASTISASGYLALANLTAQPSGAGAGSLYYNSTAFSGQGGLYVNLNGSFLPIATGTVAGGGGGGSLLSTLSAGSDAGGFGMTNLGNVAIGVDSAGARLDVEGSGGYIQVWRNSSGVIVASMTNTGAFYASNIAGGGGGGGVLSCTNPNDPNDILVQVGDFCVDKYEASVWSTPTGGTEYGTASANYPCSTYGQDCGPGTGKTIYARSVSGVTPSSYITWFQADLACANEGKHLITNAEWQAAVAGTLASNCNTGGTGGPTTTGSGGACVSAFGAENMIGSLWELVSDWGLYTSNPTTGAWGSDGEMAAGPVPAPLAMTARGGSYNTTPISSAASGPLSFFMGKDPTFSDATLGFRCGMQLR